MISSEFLTTILETREASRRLVRELDVIKEKIGLAGINYTHGHVLLYLESKGLLTIAELAELLRLDKSTTSRAVQSLIRRGYLRYEKDNADRRIKPVALTDKGTKLVLRIHEIANEEVSAALRGLTAEERTKVIEGMALYARALRRARMRRRFEIREIRPEDDPYIARVIHRVMGEFDLNVPGSSLQDEEVKAMSDAYSDDRAAYFVVTDGDEIVGGAGVSRLDGGDETVCELKKMYLLPEARGLGLGEELLEKCLDAARDAGYETCYLETIREMTSARSLYDKYGFRPLENPMGDTGHFRCDRWFSRQISNDIVPARS
jgi:putative acetyltransferase